MGINCSKLKSKGTPPNASYNFNHLNKISLPFQNQTTYTMVPKQNFSERNKRFESVNSKTINLKIFHQNITGLRNKTEELILHLLECIPPSTMFHRTSLKGI